MSFDSKFKARESPRLVEYFGRPCTIDGTDMLGVFDRAYAGDDFGDLEVSNLQPVLFVLTADADTASIAEGDVVSAVDGVAATFRVRNLKPTDEGITMLALSSDY